MKTNDEMAYAQMFSHWYSWGSPVGLGIFVLCIALTAWIAISALGGLVNVGEKGIRVEQLQQR